MTGYRIYSKRKRSTSDYNCTSAGIPCYPQRKRLWPNYILKYINFRKFAPFTISPEMINTKHGSGSVFLHLSWAFTNKMRRRIPYITSMLKLNLTLSTQHWTALSIPVLIVSHSATHNPYIHHTINHTRKLYYFNITYKLFTYYKSRDKAIYIQAGKQSATTPL